MQAGLLNEPITIEKQTFKTTGYGDNKTVEWVKRCDTRAQVKYISGMRVNDSGDLFFGANVVFHIRIYHNVENLDRIVWEGRKYRILNIEKDKTVQRKIVTTELINE